MNTARLVLVLCIFSLAVSCGGGSASLGGSSASNGNLTGAWEILATSTTLPGVQSFIEADMTQSGSNLSAGSQQLLTLTVQNGSASVDLCSTQLGFSGSLNGSTLTATLMEGGQSVRISGAVSADGKSATGTYQSDAGGCTQGDTGTFTANMISTPSGSFSGTLTDSFSRSAPTTLQLTQGANESLSGSGTVTDQGVTYNLSFSGSVIGAVFEAGGTSSSMNGTMQIVTVGHFTPSATALDGFVIGDSSGNSLYSGTLSKAGSQSVRPAFHFAAALATLTNTQ